MESIGPCGVEDKSLIVRLRSISQNVLGHHRLLCWCMWIKFIFHISGLQKIIIILVNTRTVNLRIFRNLKLIKT